MKIGLIYSPWRLHSPSFFISVNEVLHGIRENSFIFCTDSVPGTSHSSSLSMKSMTVKKHYLTSCAIIWKVSVIFFLFFFASFVLSECVSKIAVCLCESVRFFITTFYIYFTRSFHGTSWSFLYTRTRNECKINTNIEMCLSLGEQQTLYLCRLFTTLCHCVARWLCGSVAPSLCHSVQTFIFWWFFIPLANSTFAHFQITPAFLTFLSHKRFSLIVIAVIFIYCAFHERSEGEK